MARHELRGALIALRWRGNVDNALLALNEALVNAALHAGGVRRAQASLGEHTLVIEIWDNGGGFDPSPYVASQPDLMAERGRGVWLISRIADDWKVQCDRLGARLTLRFELPDEATGGSAGSASHPLLAPAP